MTAYADTADVAAYLHVEVTALSTDTERLIERASDLVDFVTHDGIDPASDAHQTAAENAVCAQVEYWQANTEGATTQNIKSKTFGKTSITYIDNANAGGRSDDLCDRARQYLLRAGLLYAGVQ